MAEIVYVLTNPVMPGVLKIGKTDKENVVERAKELFTTGVPVPFDCVYACIVERNEVAEKDMHTKFSDVRINPRREFFWLNPRKAIEALKPFELDDVTPIIREDVDNVIPEAEKNARWEARQRVIKLHPEYAEGKELYVNIARL
jgi:hypothetical protein